jgi:GNAT superfamily N-acetyltransferase
MNEENGSMDAEDPSASDDQETVDGDTEDPEKVVVYRPRKLERKDKVRGFQSGADELDEWLTKFAWRNQKANNATTYVATTSSGRVVGFYAIAVSGIALEATPAQVAGQSPPDPIPCVLLGRLAVDWQYQGRGIGQGLLRHALARAYMVSRVAGTVAVLIHARDEQAKTFYTDLTDAVPSPTDPLHLMIPMSTIEMLFDALGKNYELPEIEEDDGAPD